VLQHRKLACAGTILGTATLALLLSLTATIQGTQGNLRVDVDLVNVFPTVQTPSGSYVTGLKAEDFHIYEDGFEQKIAVFETQDVESAVGVLLDTSLSMVDILPRMKTGLLDFAHHPSSFNEFFVLTFGTSVRVFHDVGQPVRRLEDDLKALGVKGTSVLYDALVDGLRKVGGRKPERKALVVFTDGNDTASKNGFRQVLLEAQKAGALLYFIPIGTRGILIDENTLEDLAQETGGRVIYLTRSQPVPPAMEAIRQELSKQYYIGYYTNRRPGFHSLRVEVPGRDVRIRAKSGFYGS
jgi:Ca-activated chloride channel family protein